MIGDSDMMLESHRKIGDPDTMSESRKKDMGFGHDAEEQSK